MLERRIYGLETEYGVACIGPQGRVLSAEEVGRYLFREIVESGRSSNLYLTNGSRLYLDVGSHPEYATAECDGISQLVKYDKAGEIVLAKMVEEAQERIAGEGINGTIHMFKNNVDSVGNSYGCHENYLIERGIDFGRIVDGILPFLITRQILVGAGRVPLSSEQGTYSFSQRADHMWETVSSATTRSRPLINTRDESHADAQRYRRLHIIVGDSNVSEVSTGLKVAMTELVLRMIEVGVSFQGLALAHPLKAIRQISSAFLTPTMIEMADGARRTAAHIQRDYLERAQKFVQHHELDEAWLNSTLELWSRGLDAVERQDPSLVQTELDWAIKYSVLSRLQARRAISWSDAAIRRVELAYHDISPQFSVFHRLVTAGLAKRLVNPQEVNEAVHNAPQTTRARLRGEFIQRAQEQRRDYTVDWVHLKLNGQPARTVQLHDPFSAVDSRVDRLVGLL